MFAEVGSTIEFRDYNGNIRQGKCKEWEEKIECMKVETEEGPYGVHERAYIRTIKQRRGIPTGTKRDGVYGRGVKTEVCRVPEGTRELVQRLLIDLPEVVQEWELKAKDTRDWTKLNEFMRELKDFFPELFE